MDKKPKILAIITQSELGGAQRFLVQMANGLRDDFDFEIATGSDGKGEIQSYLPDSVAIHTIKSLKRDISPLNDILSLFEIRDLILKAKPATLFLMSSKAGFNGALASMLVPKKYRPKVVYRIGGWAFNDPGSVFKKGLYFTLEFLSAPFKDTIIVNSQHDFEQAKKWHIKPRKKLSLIHNGLDLSEADFFTKNEARKELLNENSNESIWLGCIANFYETKGIDVLIKALGPIKNLDFQCVIIGDGKLRPQFEKLIIDNDLKNKIHLIGKKKDAFKYLKAFDIYIQPSRKEGFSWATLEAMNAGLPIIATRVGSAPEMITHRYNGLLVPPNNSNQLSHLIKELIQSSATRERLGKNSLEIAHEHFSEKTMLEALKKVF